MFESLRGQWRTLRDSPAGHRFVCYYERRRSDRSHPVLSAAWISLGGLLTLIGTVLLVAPGPGIPLLLIGACLMARESRGIAGRLDRIERSARSCAARGPRFKP